MGPVQPDHYAILGVATGATPGEIRAAYLRLMREYHPDRNPSPQAGERARSVIAAFKVLSNLDQRDHYDWTRRRERERAAALTAVPDRTLDKKAVVVGATGAAFVAAAMVAWSMIMPVADAPMAKVISPQSTSSRGVPTSAQPQPKSPDSFIRMRPERSALAKLKAVKPAQIEKREIAVKAPRQRERAQVASSEEAAPVPAARRLPKVIPARIVRVNTTKVPPAEVKPKPIADTGSDLASLDQFVMSFYGQSWRFGDPSRRAALEQSRSSFVARRGACASEACKRAAYIALQRDISAIVASGHKAH